MRHIGAIGVAGLVQGKVFFLTRAIAAAQNWGTFGSTYLLLAIEIAPIIIVFPLVLALTSGPASAGLGPVHAVLAAALSSLLTVLVVDEYTTGVACGRLCGGFPGGWRLFQSDLPLAEGVTLCLTLILLAVSSLMRGLLRWPHRGSRRQWPANEITLHQPARGLPWPLRWTFVPLILILSITISYNWALQNLLPATMTPPSITVPVPPVTGPVPTAAVCSSDAALYTNITSPDEVLTREARLAGIAAASDSPALKAFGTTLAEGLQKQKLDRITSRALNAIQRYCYSAAPPNMQV